ncbi:ATPase inhibitor, mitochondrial isoform X2 [Macrotis lagotis]|uniref:ATPase inhibitor, mitochondrial isoform X2 n=1 Tax=Macrotis lagotis TaxID=92651 RepID=UPI003D68A9A6
MACTTVAATRLGLGLWGARTMQARGYLDRQFSSNPADTSDSGAIREAGGAFGKREKAEEDRYFRWRDCPHQCNPAGILSNTKREEQRAAGCPEGASSGRNYTP